MVENDGKETKGVSGNRFNRLEFAGAFGDLGTLIPFLVGYITISKLNPVGILFTFGIFLIGCGLYYKTPIPVQPMKAIGAAAIAQSVTITSGMIWGAGIFTGLFWLILGLTGKLSYISKIATKPVIRGITLGLGLLFILDGTNRMKTNIPIAFIAVIITFLLLSNKHIPAMFALIIFGIAASFIIDPSQIAGLGQIRFDFCLPQYSLGNITYADIISGILILGIPQIPLTLGNAVITVTDENNRLFPEHPVTENKVAITQGIMNLLSPVFGGIPVCHGAGGMAGHVRFGARTGGATIILGSLLLVLGLCFGSSVLFLFNIFPNCILGVILFFAGLELAMSSRDVGREKGEFYIMLVTAGFSLWNIGIGFVAGLIMQVLVGKNIIKL